ncbi:CPBP family intramembrane metalloprotease [Inquilinus sp. KBS0705]|nr:CPBP family intramembrane metalloprotease [Inquilinus sp. KBS0705]
MNLAVKTRLVNLLWIGVFFLLLAAITLPLILLSAEYHFKISMPWQALITVVTTVLIQLMRKEPVHLVTGRINWRWLKLHMTGLLIGAALMLIPAFFLFAGGWVHWKSAPCELSSILEVTLIYLSVAIAEETLFRGFIFQRLLTSIGEWPGQILIGGYFLLIHLDNPGMTGATKAFAGINIFFASLMFGLAVIRFKSLAVAIGIHLMANWVQGPLLGFSVSGKAGSSILIPVFSTGPVWLTGGNFGLEASLPGLTCVILFIIFLYRLKPSEKKLP